MPIQLRAPNEKGAKVISSDVLPPTRIFMFIRIYTSFIDFVTDIHTYLFIYHVYTYLWIYTSDMDINIYVCICACSLLNQLTLTFIHIYTSFIYLVMDIHVYIICTYLWIHPSSVDLAREQIHWAR